MSVAAPFVSVVTPVYNTADCLRQCIESVLGQSYENFEYLIVNNCSTDGSREIAAEYAEKDSRVRVVDNPGLLPQPVNYNHSLRQISRSSKYCKMVQADDWIYPDCLQEMVFVAESDPEIALVGAYEMAGSRVRCQGLPCRGPDKLVTVMSGREACRAFFLQNDSYFGTPTSVLYRADLVRRRGSFFREDSYCEDSEACFEILEGHRFGFVHKILTFSRVDNLSISTSVRNFDPVHLLTRYILIRKYGCMYLDESEHLECLNRAGKQLYEMLAYQLFHRRGARFWDYFQKGFRMADDRLNWWKLIFMQPVRMLAWMGNPYSTGERLFGYLRGAFLPSTAAGTKRSEIKKET